MSEAELRAARVALAEAHRRLQEAQAVTSAHERYLSCMAALYAIRSAHQALTIAGGGYVPTSTNREIHEAAARLAAEGPG